MTYTLFQKVNNFTYYRFTMKKLCKCLGDCGKKFLSVLAA